MTDGVSWELKGDGQAWGSRVRGPGAELGVLKARAGASDAGRWHLTRAGGRGGAEVQRLQGASSEPTAGSSGLRPCGPDKKRSREAPWPEPAQTEVPPPCLRPGQTQRPPGGPREMAAPLHGAPQRV